MKLNRKQTEMIIRLNLARVQIACNPLRGPTIRAEGLLTNPLRPAPKRGLAEITGT